VLQIIQLHACFKTLPNPSWMRSTAFSILLKCDALLLVNWLSTFRNNFHTQFSMDRINYLIFRPSYMRPLGGFVTSNPELKLTRTRKPQYMTICRRGFHCGKAKTVRCRTSLFCCDNFSDPYRYSRSVWHCQQTGYEAGSYICILLK
jgi:hypothetical protein